MQTPSDVTQVLRQATARDPQAVDQLFVLLYEDLHKVAEERLRYERSDHTLQATALLNEAYLRLVDQTRCQWRDRVHFLAVAGTIMRRILVDHARGRGRRKRGGDWRRVPLESVFSLGSEEGADTVLALDEALQALARQDPEKARVVEMRFFAGLTEEECAEALGVTSRTVRRHWRYAQAWLYREMSAGLNDA